MMSFGCLNLATAWYTLYPPPPEDSEKDNENLENLQRIRLELIKLLESSEAKECFDCNRLRCCCPENCSSNSSTLSRLSSDIPNSCDQSVESYSDQSSSSMEDAPIPPPANELPKPEWKSSVADWIRASSTPNSEPSTSQDSKHFFDMEEEDSDAEITEDMFRANGISLQSEAREPCNHSENHLQTASNTNVSYQDGNTQVPEEAGNDVVISREWPKTIWDELTSPDEENWPAITNEEQPTNTMATFFRSFSEVASGSTSNANGATNGYSYF